MRRLYLSALLVVLTDCSFAQTQSALPGRLEFFGGYLDAGEFPYNEFRFSGFSLPSDFGTHYGMEFSIIRELNQRFGIKADFSTQFQSNSFPS